MPWSRPRHTERRRLSRPTPAWASGLYSAAWALVLPAVLAKMWWRGRLEPAYRRGWAQRLGQWNPADAADRRTPQSAPRVWLHAVSLGETRAAQPLVESLRQALPGMQLLLTTGTATGWDAGQDMLRPGDLQGWAPFDTATAPRRFFGLMRPDVGILMETETWPNLVREAVVAQVPMVLANARLSERSLLKGLRWPALTRPMMASLAGVLAQTPDDAERLVLAGVRPDRVQVMGNLKFDLQPSVAQLEQGQHWAGVTKAAQRRVVLAASWREGEDQDLLRAWLGQRQGRRHEADSSNLTPLLMVVPRHPQRFDEVHAALLAAGLSVSRRSSWPAQGPTAQDARADVWLGDSIGEMAAYYAAADVALLGGSYARLGGQNLIEAAACNCPVIAGPYTFNFQEAADRAIEEGAARRASDLQQAVALALALRPAELEMHRAAAHAFCGRHAGAADRQSQAVVALLRSVAQKRR